MNLVCFGITPHQEAPDLFGVLAVEGTMQWVTYDHVTEALHFGREVHIRHLRPAEQGRVDKILALYKVGEEISARIGAVLDVPADAERVARAREASSEPAGDTSALHSDAQDQAEA